MDSRENQPGGGPPGDRIPETIDHYRILKRIGRGGQGDVYLAHDPNLDLQVAIKVLLAEQNRDEFIQRFQTEARASVRLTAPNVVRVFNFNPTYPYLVMEYCGDGDLNYWIKRRQPIQLSESIDLIRQICAGLRIAHEHVPMILHRDLKPGNVLFTGKTPKVADFGLAKMLSSGTAVTQTRGMMGTVSYSSPEQLKDASNVDHRTDLWAVGVMLYELLTFCRPFDKPGDDYVNVAIKVRMESHAQPNYEVPKPIWSVVERALQKNPEERFQSAKEMMDALDEAEKELGDAAGLALPPASALSEMDQLALQASEQLDGGDMNGATTYVNQMRSLSIDHSLPRYWSRRLKDLKSTAESTGESGIDTATQRQADWLESRLQSVRGLLDNHAFREARRQVGELLIKDPDNSVVQQYIQRINEEETRLNSAINSAHEAADQARSKGDFVRLHKIWKDLHEEFPDHPDVVAELAVSEREARQQERKRERASTEVRVKTAIESGDLQGALTIWDGYLAIEPDDTEASEARAKLQQQVASKKRELRIDDAEKRAKACIQTGDLQAAIKIWEKVLSEEPSSERAFSQLESLKKKLESEELDALRASTRSSAAERVSAGDIEGAIGVWTRLLSRVDGDVEAMSELSSLRKTLSDQGRAWILRKLELRRVAISARLNSGRYQSMKDAESALREQFELASQAVKKPDNDLESALAGLLTAHDRAERELGKRMDDARVALSASVHRARELLDELEPDAGAVASQLESALRRATSRLARKYEDASEGDPLRPIEEATARVEQRLNETAKAREASIENARKGADRALKGVREAIGGREGDAFQPELDRLERQLAIGSAERLAGVERAADALRSRIQLHDATFRTRNIQKIDAAEANVLAHPEWLEEPAVVEALEALQPLREDWRVGESALERAIETLEQAGQQANAAEQKRAQRCQQIFDRSKQRAGKISSKALDSLVEEGKSLLQQGRPDALDAWSERFAAVADSEQIENLWSEQKGAIQQAEAQASRGTTPPALKQLRSALAQGDIDQAESLARSLKNTANDTADANRIALPDVAAKVLAHNRAVGNPAADHYEKAQKRLRSKPNDVAAAEALRSAQLRLAALPQGKGGALLQWAGPIAAALIVIAGSVWLFWPQNTSSFTVALVSLDEPIQIQRLSREGTELSHPLVGADVGQEGTRASLEPGNYTLTSSSGQDVTFSVPSPGPILLSAGTQDREGELLRALGLDEASLQAAPDSAGEGAEQ